MNAPLSPDSSHEPTSARTLLPPDVSAVGLAAVLRQELWRRWHRGERVTVEEYLARFPTLRDHPDAVIDLVADEMALREERGETPQLAEYLARFPAHASALRAQFEFRRQWREGLVVPPTNHGVPSPPPDLASDLPATPAAAGTVAVPGYEILEVLGKGGMGVVYRAQQLGLGRIVALKMIRHAEYADDEERRRFHSEAEAVARLQHPHIVQIHEVGKTGELPYFSLEYCSGGSLADQLHGTPWEAQRAARLVQTLAGAVAAAHAAGIVHRDLKPANVLLTADGTPKVTDFGLAKRLDVPGLTATGAIVGTPSYMAPEQAGGKGKEVGPAADVYALGAVLYELLTGRPPFRGPTALETVFQVLNEMPVPVRRLQPKVPRDLETICLKCLEKEPKKRYLSAMALAEDLRRFGAGEPVAARPIGWLGRAVRWARRRPAQASVLVLILLVLVGSVVGASLFALHERKRLGQIEKANEILRSVFRDLDPEQEEKEGLPLRVQLGQRLDQATKLLEGDAVGDPLVVARLQMDLGETQRNLGYPERAIALQTKARQTFESLLGPDHRDTLTSMSYLAAAYRDAGQQDKALLLYEEVLQKCQVRLGSDHPDTLDNRNSLALAYQEAGQLDKALPLFEQALEGMKVRLGENDRKTLITMNNLALAYRAAGQLNKAIPLLEEALERIKVSLGPDHADTPTILNALASAYQDAGQLDKALLLFEQAVEKFRATLGPDHSDTLSALNNLAMAYEDVGQRNKALPLYEQILEKRQAKFGPDHPLTLGVLNNLAKAYLAAGQPQKALPLSQQALEKARTKLGPDHPNTLIFANNLAEVYQALGRLDQALPLFEQTLEKMKAKFGADHSRTLTCMHRLANALQEAKQHDRALALWRELVALESKKLPADRAGNLAGLGRCLLQMGQPGEAEPLLREALGIREQKQPDAWETFHTRSLVGGCLLGQKKYAAAEPLLLAGYDGMEKRQAKIPFPDKVYLKEALERVIQLYEATDRKDQAEKWRQKRAAKTDTRCFDDWRRV
jgi:tetratricopeptide (TPR) repeat protein/tRNA A-37 threonylcarbamoyl transferase component Bud32